MKPQPLVEWLEPSPEVIEAITRQAKIDRSRAVWRMLQGLFTSHAADEGQSMPAGAAPHGKSS
jgi:hypothetical protein